MKISSKLLLILLFVGSIIFTSCNNKLEVNGESAAKVVVYGLLNYGDTAHYLKIYKTFISEENLYVAAQNQDNYLLYDSIEVSLIETIGGAYTRTLMFSTTTEVPKDSGIFTNPNNPTNQVLYVNRDVLVPTATYELQVKNRYSGKLMASSMSALPYPKTYITSPTNEYINNPLRITQSSQLDFTPANGSIKINMPMINALRYEAYYEFYYWEKPYNTAPDWTLHGPIKIYVGKVAVSETATSFSFNWSPKSFFTMLLSRIPHLDGSDPIVRKCGPVYLSVWGAGPDYSNYITNATESSSSIIEERPISTNVNNGLGLFSSRYCVKYTYSVGPVTLAALFNESAYSELHFQN